MRLHRQWDLRALGVSLLLALATAGCLPAGGGGSAYQPTTYNQDAGPGADMGSAPVDSGPADAGKPPLDAGLPDAAKPDAGPPTCQGKCGGPYQPQLSCQCNNICTKYNNCCPDWEALCKPALLSCQGRCQESYAEGLPCQCHGDCLAKGDCCADYAKICAGGDLDFIEAKPGECDAAESWHNFQYHKDGDTIVLSNDDIIRLLVVNTPEMSSADCYAKEASDFTYKVMHGAGIVCMTKDPSQPDKDVYGRLLRYVYYKDPAANYKPVQLNARLIRLGYGHVFYPWAKGAVHEKISLLMQATAKAEKIGGWSKCVWD